MLKARKKVLPAGHCWALCSEAVLICLVVLNTPFTVICPTLSPAPDGPDTPQDFDGYTVCIFCHIGLDKFINLILLILITNRYTPYMLEKITHKRPHFKFEQVRRSKKNLKFGHNVSMWKGELLFSSVGPVKLIHGH